MPLIILIINEFFDSKHQLLLCEGERHIFSGCIARWNSVSKLRENILEVSHWHSRVQLLVPSLSQEHFQIWKCLLRKPLCCKVWLLQNYWESIWCWCRLWHKWYSSITGNELLFRQRFIEKLHTLRVLLLHILPKFHITITIIKTQWEQRRMSDSSKRGASCRFFKCKKWRTFKHWSWHWRNWTNHSYLLVTDWKSRGAHLWRQSIVGEGLLRSICQRPHSHL